MSMYSCEKKRTKSKKSNGTVTKPNHKIEAIKVTVERKKKCNDKALQIVIDFSEGTISEDTLLTNLKFINQEHYQDIVEERAINKCCGYPLCSNLLKNIPVKQYHISTSLNKVFDITDRKNFCSNLCYKASKFLKDQISTSPLWLREDESSTSYTLISLQSKGGMTGDEVDIGVIPVKLDIDGLAQTATTEPDENSIPKSSNLDSDTKEESKSSSSNNSITIEGCSAEKKTIDSLRRDSPLGDKGCSLGEEKLLTLETKSSGNFTYDKAEHVNDSSLTKYRECQLDGISSPGANVCHEKINNDSLVIEKETPPLNSSMVNNIKLQNNMSKSHKHSSKRKSNLKNKNNIVNPIQNAIFKIEQVLKEWISIDSLCFIFGEERMKEILAEKKSLLVNGQTLPAFTQDVHFYERYLAICKKLAILELEDTKVDTSFREEVKKPLPDYEALKEEARQMDIKVKMFFKGDKVQFEEPVLNEGATVESKEVTAEPVLPLVDIHAQKALRRRIVTDKLRRVMQDLQKSLGLRGFNLTGEVRALVSTLTLSAHNITMRPAEWNLVSIAIIKLLSLRDKTLAQALNSTTANTHLTLLLMSYSLDAGYLDRLMVWLTDVEAVLQKT